MSAARSGRVPTADGLSLAYADDGPLEGAATPVLCLPGLSRNQRDFAALAAALSPERRVIRLDMRGRGASDHDPDPANYNPLVEAQDALGALAALGVARAAIVGTSRGGIQAMLIAQLAPQALAGAVLNDVGPRLEREGLKRIVATLAAAPEAHDDWPSAVAAVRAANEAQFPTLSDEEWRAFARRLWRDAGGRPVRDFDPALLAGADAALEGELPELWPQFDALAALPLLTIRGAHSDILSDTTLAEMRDRAPAMRALTLADRGHTPFLDEPEAIAAIRALLETIDACPPISTPSSPPPTA